MPDRRIHAPEGKQPLAPPPERKDAQASSRTAKGDAIRHAGIGIMALLLWWGAYSSLVPLSQWLTCDLLSIEGGTPLGDAVEFFFYDTPKILLLLALMIYVVGWLRAGLRVERVRDYLAGKGRGIGYVLGAGFGAITPFCSCSSIPLFLGFAMARIPLGITMAFLITSPLINEVAVVLLWGLLGWKFTALYVAAGMGAGIVGGIVMDAIHAERWLQPFLLDAMKNAPVQMAPGQPRQGESEKIGPGERHAFARSETCAIFRRVWPWVVIGVGLGAALHGFVPQGWIVDNLGAGQWWSVPAAVVTGIPLYANVTGIIPVMESLLLKGMPPGTTLAFCMGTVAFSLPEALMLRQVMRWKLLAVFLGLLLVMFTLVGWLLNGLQAQIL